MKRERYSNLSWLSKNGVSTLIVDMEEEHILNVLRNVGQKLLLAEKFPEVIEFQEYNKVKYQTYADALYSEYLYRQELVEQSYNEYVDQQIYEQSVLDMHEYNNYDYDRYGNKL